MALSYSTSVKDQVAGYLFSNTYAGLGTGYQQTLIDKWGASVLKEFETLAQWFTLTTATGNAPDEWEPAYVDGIIARIEGNAHPERREASNRQAASSRRQAVESYARLAVDYNPSSTTEAFVYQLANIRKYVLAHCIRLPKPFYPDLMVVDAAFEETVQFVFNKAGWAFRRRPVTKVVTRTAFAGGSWTESTKTITGLTGIGTSLGTGTRAYITAGTSTRLREFSIVSSTSSTIVLADSLSETGANLTGADIAGFYYIVTFEGLESGESFDSIASTRFRYTGTTDAGLSLDWLNADDFASARSGDGNSAGQPRYFRTHQPSGTTTAWLLSPPPDGNYTLRGEVFTAQPTDPTSATATTLFAKFAAEFLPAIRRGTLDRTLTNHGRHDESIHGQVTDEIETLFPQYQDPGNADTRTGPMDVYQDRAEQAWGGSWGQGI